MCYYRAVIQRRPVTTVLIPGSNLCPCLEMQGTAAAGILSKAQNAEVTGSGSISGRNGCDVLIRDLSSVLLYMLDEGQVMGRYLTNGRSETFDT